MKQHRILILGGGFAGLNTALELTKRFRHVDGYEIVLIDRHPEHLYTPLLYEVASGCLEDNGRVCRGSLKEGATIGFESFIKMTGSRVRFHPGELQSIDTVKNLVRLKDQDDLSYDTLVIALGSETNCYGIPGLEQYAYAMKSLREAYRIRARLHDFLERCEQGKERCLDVVIGGAGATGTELAAELAHFFGRLTRTGQLQKKNWSLRLVEMGPQILNTFSPRVRERAMRRLKQLGVQILTDTKIEEVHDRTIRLSTKTGGPETTEADVVVWCGGIQPARMLKQTRLPLGPKGHVVVDGTFLVAGYDSVFALGDCAQFQDPHTKEFVPPLAQAAIAQSKQLAENIWHHVHHKPLHAWHPPHTWRTILPLGGAYAVSDLGVTVMQGKLGYALRRFVDFLYLYQLLPVRDAFRIWFEGVKVYLKND